MLRFRGKVAIVSGGLGAIGLASGRRLADEGATVVLADLPGRAVPQVPGDALIVLPLDVTSAAGWARVIDETTARFGGIDVLVNNAGVITPGPIPFDEVTLEEWHRVFSINLDGTLFGTQAAMRAMKARNGGAIVNIGSVAGYVGSRDGAPYGTSKAAVRFLSKQAAMSAAKLGYGVRVNTVHPAFVWTPMVAPKLIAQHGSEENAMEAMRAMHPLGRIPTPQDVAAAVAFLASDDAASITGADLVVDAGRLLQ